MKKTVLKYHHIAKLFRRIIAQLRSDDCKFYFSHSVKSDSFLCFNKYLRRFFVPSIIRPKTAGYSKSCETLILSFSKAPQDLQVYEPIRAAVVQRLVTMERRSKTYRTSLPPQSFATLNTKIHVRLSTSVMSGYSSGDGLIINSSCRGELKPNKRCFRLLSWKRKHYCLNCLCQSMVIKGIKGRVLARIGQKRKTTERYKHLIKRFLSLQIFR